MFVRLVETIITITCIKLVYCPSMSLLLSAQCHPIVLALAYFCVIYTHLFRIEVIKADNERLADELREIKTMKINREHQMRESTKIEKRKPKTDSRSIPGRFAVCSSTDELDYVHSSVCNVYQLYIELAPCHTLHAFHAQRIILSQFLTVNHLSKKNRNYGVRSSEAHFLNCLNVNFIKSFDEVSPGLTCLCQNNCC